MNPAILLVDDEQALRQMTNRALAHLGYRIVEAANGAEALALLAESEISLIVLDYNMPVMDGIEFLRLLRGDLKSDIPVLMMSGNADLEVRKSCYALGVFDFIRKPEDIDVLQARVVTGLKIAELIEYRRKTGIDMQIAAGILEDLKIPTEASSQYLEIKTYTASYAPVGGDISLIFGAEGDSPVALVGDIRGHGVSAALFSIFVSVTVRRAYRETLTPHKMLTRLNREIAEIMPKNFFISMICCLYDRKSASLQYANAGHPSPFLFSAGQVVPLESLGEPPLGVDRNQEFHSLTSPFRPGDWLLMFTDGAEEALGFDSEATGISQLPEVHSSKAVFDQMVAELKTKNAATDDMTVTMLWPK